MARERLPHNGWPSAHHAAHTPSHIRPIVPGAKFIVDCACGAAFDSAAATGDEAVKEFAERHACSDSPRGDTCGMIATAYPDALAG